MIINKLLNIRENPFWRTWNAFVRIKLAINRFLPSLFKDLQTDFVKLMEIIGIYDDKNNFTVTHSDNKCKTKYILPKIESNTDNKPVIFISACESQKITGGWKYNGGIKEFNYLVKLLRTKGYEAYIVTYDGKYEPWLIEHQSHISLAEFSHKLRTLSNVRCVTSWAAAKAFIKECPHLYFWDMEVATSDKRQFRLLANLYRQKIRNSAGIPRTIQAWHINNFQHPCILLPNLLDHHFWLPIESKRKPYHVGYMDEGSHTQEYIQCIKNITQENHLNIEFQLLKGDEQSILQTMQSCEVFLTMNIGKDALWGESGPLTPLEAMATGCIPIAFDILGPREIIQSGFNGFIVPRYRPDLMAEALVNIYKKPDELKRLSTNALNMMSSCHTFEARWSAVKEFLHLE